MPRPGAQVIRKSSHAAPLLHVCAKKLSKTHFYSLEKCIFDDVLEKYCCWLPLCRSCCPHQTWTLLALPPTPPPGNSPYYNRKPDTTTRSPILQPETGPYYN